VQLCIHINFNGLTILKMYVSRGSEKCTFRSSGKAKIGLTGAINSTKSRGIKLCSLTGYSRAGTSF
jgi:hypothetical protein